MKKAFLQKVIVGIITATTMTTLTPLGVSAATNKSIDTNSYNFMLNKSLKTGWVSENGKWYCFDEMGNMKTGWIKDNGKWYYCDNNGVMQTGVVNVNGKAYCLNSSGAMETGKVIINDKSYKCSLNGQVVSVKGPKVDKVFDANNNVVKDNNQNSTVINLNDNQGTTNSDTSTENTNTTTITGSTTTSDNTTANTNTTTGSTTTSDNTATTANTTNTSTTTNNGATNISNVDVQGLPQLPQNYPISVQASAEDQILQLMNAKRTEAGLQPLTLDNTLLQVARYKSNDMIQNNFFDHTNPDGTKWTNWLQAIGYKYATTGENIAYNTYDAVELFNQWWNSPGHRANMMNASYNKVGIGVLNGNGKFMGTQTFSN